MQVALLTRSAMWYNPAPCGQFDGAEDAALLVLARRHHLLPLPLDDPGRWEPGQQVDVRLVLGQDHRACGHGRDLFDGCVTIAQRWQHQSSSGFRMAGAASPSADEHETTREEV